MSELEDRPAGKEVMLMATCLCDAFFAGVGRATVEVLEHLGCTVCFPEDQTCCGQPPFNGGDFESSRAVVRHTLGVFAGDLPIVVPSGSCAAMQFHGNLLQFEGETDLPAVKRMAARTWELFDFIVHGLGVDRWDGRLEKKIAIHHSCHTRGTKTGEAMRTLLGSIEGLEILEFGQGEQCCGFGGTFSVTFPHISAEMGTVKLDHALEPNPDLVISADMSCLMHLRGLATKQGREIETRHAVEVLRDVMKERGRHLMSEQSIDRHARDLSPVTRDAIAGTAARRTQRRFDLLGQDYGDPDALRKTAARIKQHTLDHLDTYLEQAESALKANGAQVHFASDTDAARKKILDILLSCGARMIVKSKSMATEEIHLNSFLEGHGIQCVESDLGEFIVQIDGDTPSHIVQPIIHKNRQQVAESFERHGLGEYNDDPETITLRARRHLREKYMESDAGVTGGNFISAESGRIVLVTNEGNARFCMAPNKVHIALVGIEKIVPRDRDFALFLNLLARSATVQHISVYTQFINGPKAAGQPSGPEEMHVVLLDNGRSEVLGGDCREILRCIRCGACQNVCPVYRQASGHAYRAVYGGPIGAVLSPLLAGKDFAKYADLPKASSLCGACNEVCPVDIPIPDMLLRLRQRAVKEGVPSPGSPPMGPFVSMATSPGTWRVAMTASKAMNYLPVSMLPVKPLREWLKVRTLPRWRGGEFRAWMKDRKEADR